MFVRVTRAPQRRGMLRCFSTLGCPELTLDAARALAARFGLGAIEVRALGGSLDLPAHFAAHHGTPEKLAAPRAAGGAGGDRDSAGPRPPPVASGKATEGGRGPTSDTVRVVAFNASLRLIGGSAADRDQLLALAPWAEAFGVPWLRVFDGGKHADAAELAEAAATLRWWRELRARQGWRTDLVVETHDSFFTAAAIGRFLAAAPGTRMLWDAHHTWRKGGEDPVATWRAIRPAVEHIHIKDSVPVPSARHPYTYVLPGDGGFPVAPLLAALRADGFAGPVSLEWEKVWHPALPPLEEALRTAAERQWW